MITNEQIQAFEELWEAFNKWQHFARDASNLQTRVDITAARRDSAEMELREVGAKWCQLMSQQKEAHQVR